MLAVSYNNSCSRKTSKSTRKKLQNTLNMPEHHRVRQASRFPQVETASYRSPKVQRRKFASPLESLTSGVRHMRMASPDQKVYKGKDEMHDLTSKPACCGFGEEPPAQVPRLLAKRTRSDEQSAILGATWPSVRPPCAPSASTLARCVSGRCSSAPQS